MQRNEFFKALNRALRPLRDDERQRYLDNYAELVDDKLEAGVSEEAAIAGLDDPAAVALPILADARERGALKPTHSPLTVCLLALGSPVWVALLISLAAVGLALYVTAWALVIAVCAAELSLAIVLPASVVFFAANAASNLPFCLFVLGLGLVCAAAAAALWKPLVRLISGFASSSAQKARGFIHNLKRKGSALLS